MLSLTRIKNNIPGVRNLEYEDMLMEYGNNLIIKEKPLKAYDGRIRGNRILIRNNMAPKEKSCVLAEEIGHYYTTVGNILDQSNVGNRKQELRARLWAYDKMIGLEGIVKSYQHGCRNLYETAEYLDVTENFLKDALIAFQNKYGINVEYGKYVITFIPTLDVKQI